MKTYIITEELRTKLINELPLTVYGPGGGVIYSDLNAELANTLRSLTPLIETAPSVVTREAIDHPSLTKVSVDRAFRVRDTGLDFVAFKSGWWAALAELDYDALQPPAPQPVELSVAHLTAQPAQADEAPSIEEGGKILSEFFTKASYLSHPDVVPAWQGTDHGDTFEAWDKRFFEHAAALLLQRKTTQVDEVPSVEELVDCIYCAQSSWDKDQEDDAKRIAQSIHALLLQRKGGR